MYRNQYLNQSVPNLSATGRDIVNGSVGGTTNDAVLRFNVANDVVTGAPGLAIVHNAVNGDHVAVTRAGVYMVSFQFSQAAATTVNLGISLNVAAAGLTGDPSLANAGTLQAIENVLPAANTVYTLLSTLVVVTKAQAAVAGGALIRFLGTDGGGAVVPDATILDNLECAFRVVLCSNII